MYSEMIGLAFKARQNAYAPYSNFKVGACLKTKCGRYFLGCNIENASYSATICAERTAIFKAVSEGYTQFESIVIVGGTGDDKDCQIITPCGVCRQALSEFCDKDFKIILADGNKNSKVYTLADLLPNSFNL